MSFYGLSVSAGKTAYVEADSMHPVELTNACLRKLPKNPTARVLIEVSSGDPEPEENLNQPTIVAVLTPSSGIEHRKLSILVTSRMAVRLSGDAAGAIVDVVGFMGEVVEESSESESESDIEDDFAFAAALSGGFEDSDSDPEMDDSSDETVPEVSKKSPQPTKHNALVPAAGQNESKRIKTHKSGLKYQDLIYGTGNAVRVGHNVAVEYVLRLESGKIVDRTKKRKPFRFRLGIGECIKGFDVGIAGMKEGGERHLIVPSSLGYGKQGAPPDIPPNATLFFDVKVVKAW